MSYISIISSRPVRLIDVARRKKNGIINIGSAILIDIRNVLEPLHRVVELQIEVERSAPVRR